MDLNQILNLKTNEEFVNFYFRHENDGFIPYIKYDKIQHLINFMHNKIYSMDEITKESITEMLDELKQIDIQEYYFIKGRVMSDNYSTYRIPTPADVIDVHVTVDGIDKVLKLGKKKNDILNMEKRMYTKQYISEYDNELNDLSELKKINKNHNYNLQLRDIVLKYLVLSVSDKLYKDSMFDMEDLLSIFSASEVYGIRINDTLEDMMVDTKKIYNNMDEDYKKTLGFKYSIVNRKISGNCR